jgi:DNA mismatch endonuclease (patch repair protein)
MTAKSIDVARSEQMRLIRSKDTKPELAVRRALFALGFRYRLHYKKLPGRPDLAFPGKKKAIFIHGCFWHRHPGCGKSRTPKSHLDYWIPKFESNVLRDERNQKELLEAGWKFLVVWECELHNLDETIKKISRFLAR